MMNETDLQRIAVVLRSNVELLKQLHTLQFSGTDIKYQLFLDLAKSKGTLLGMMRDLMILEFYFQAEQLEIEHSKYGLRQIHFYFSNSFGLVRSLSLVEMPREGEFVICAYADWAVPQPQ